MMNRRLKKNKKSGFAILFAVLASSLMITIGISIFNITLKEIMIATSAQDSERAYYAADSARECALYWDIKAGSFPTCLDSSCATPSTSTKNTIKCNGNSIILSFVKQGSYVYNYATTTFFRYGAITEPDADMTIKKTFTAGSPDIIKTEITSKGHNFGILGKRVERGVTQTYNSN
ncbi:MAG: hypothetical protein WC915_05455 [archaeon]|jgi:hypothetical protein